MAVTPTSKSDENELSQDQTHITVQVKYNNIEKTISGAPEQVYLFLNRFFEEFLPSFTIAEKLALHVDLQTLAGDSQNIIAFAQEGAYLLAPRNKLTDNETLALLLLANYLGQKLGKTRGEGMSKEELQTKLGKDSKITSTRLGELIKAEMATKTLDEKYRITTFGLVQMHKEILPRIRTKLEA